MTAEPVRQRKARQFLQHIQYTVDLVPAKIGDRFEERDNAIQYSRQDIFDACPCGLPFLRKGAADKFDKALQNAGACTHAFRYGFLQNTKEIRNIVLADLNYSA